MNFTPVGNYVLVLPMETPDTTPSGLVLPESSKEKPNQGVVQRVGQGIRNDLGNLISPTVKVNDTVFFQKYSGTEMKLDGVKYLLLRESDLLGYLSE